MPDTTRRSAPDAPSVAVETNAHAVAGDVATLRVHARNLAPDARDLRFWILGLEDAWRPAVVEAAAISPDATVTAELLITPSAGAAPGSYACVVVVESGAGAAAVRTVADATVRVDGASDVVLAVEPADVRGRGRGKIEVVVGNTGITVAEVSLDAFGDESVDVELDEPVVELRPAETIRVPGTVRARRRLVGAQVRHAYQVVATGQAAPQRVHGSFTSRALFSSAALRVVAVIAVVAVWVAGALIALPRLTDAISADGTPTPTQTPGTADGSSGGDDGQSGTGGAGTGGSDGDGTDGGGATGDAGAEGLRVSGVVSGASPDNVAVEVVPTASLWSSQTGTSNAGARTTTSGAPGKTVAFSLALDPVDTPQRLTTRTNTNGVWAIAGLSASARYLVTISKAGFSTQRVVMTGAELAAAPLETDLPAGEGSMSGVVTGPNGPIGGVELTLSDGTTTVTTRSATTGQIGRWQVDGLVTPSTYLVSASAADLGSESQLVDLPAAGSRELSFSLEAGVATVSGRVVGIDSLGSTGGLGGITVTATDGTTTRTATTVTGDDAGRFLLSGLPAPARYTVTISGAGYSTVTRQVTLTPEGVSGWTISLTASGGAVTGTVTDDAGAGITAAGLVLTSSADKTLTYKTMSASDGSGTFRFSGVAPGVYVLSAQSFGHESSYAEVIFRAGTTATADLVLVRIPGDGLVATSTITGRVVDASTGGQITCPMLVEQETCVVTATVTAQDVDGVSHTVTSEATPDEQYRLPATGSAVEGLLPGRYVVSITAPGYEPGTVTVTVPMAAEAEAATVALVPSPSLVGSVLARTGVLPSGVCVIARAVTETGPAPTGCDNSNPECTSATSRCELVEAQGTYAMDRLRAGTYDVTVVGLSDGYVPPASQRMTLLPGEVRRYDVLIERNGIVSVTALLSDGGGSVTPATDTWVRAELVGGGVEDQTQVNDNGFARLTDLPPGTYDVIGSATEGGAAIATTRLTIGLNQEISLQLVLAEAVDGVIARVTYQRSAATTVGIPDATISITGVVGYDGTVPRPDQQNFTTDSSGRVQICTVAAPDCQAVLPLVENLVDVRVTANGFETFAANNVPLASLDTILISPAYQLLDGQLRLDPVDSGAAQDARFEVLAAPPGVVDLSLRSDANGQVTFTDPSLLQENAIRPGDYTIVAKLDGFAATTISFSIELRDGDDPEVSAQQWTLRRDARVGLQAVYTPPGGTALPVPGAVVTLHLPDDSVIERTASPTQTVLDFGTLPSGAGYTVDVKIPGYRSVLSWPLTVPAGRLFTDPLPVPVQRLGTIRGSVVTVLGSQDWTQALPGATVTAKGPDDVTFTVTTGSDGSYRVTGTLEADGLAPGDWALQATADQHEPPDAEKGEPDATETVTDLDLAESVDAQTLGLSPKLSSLTVTVKDGDTKIEGLNVTLVYSDVEQVPPIAPCVEDVGSCLTGDGSYQFLNLLPLTYTLFISGQGYMPLSTPVTIEAGTDPTRVVPITAPNGSIQGLVLRTRPDGTATPVTDADPDLMRVVLGQDGDDLDTSEISDSGGYAFGDLGAGTYSLEVQRRDDDSDAWSTVTTKNVTVVSGQSAVIDLVIASVSRPVRVDVTSTNGTDLAGGLVTLHGTLDGAEVTFGPQPLGRTGTGFATTFNQVPVGSWIATVAGPAGHHGSYDSASITVAASSPATVTQSIDIAETELRLHAPLPTGTPPPPSQVTVTVTSSDDNDDDEVRVTLIPGASDSVLFLPDTGWDLTVAAPAGPGWSAAVAPATVAQEAVRLLATVTLTFDPVDTTTTVSVAPASATAGTDLVATVAVAATDSGDPAPEGEVSISYRRGTSGPWTDVGSEEWEGESMEVEISTDGWQAGTYQVRAEFAGDVGWDDSDDTQGNVSITVADDGGAAVAGTDGAGAGDGSDNNGSDSNGTGTDGTGTDGTGTDGSG